MKHKHVGKPDEACYPGCYQELDERLRMKDRIKMWCGVAILFALAVGSMLLLSFYL